MKTLLAGGMVVNVFTGELERANVLLDGPIIAGVGDYTPDEADEVRDVTGKTICPGFIDGHMHIESTMLLPAELARVSAARHDRHRRRPARNRQRVRRIGRELHARGERGASDDGVHHAALLCACHAV